jgi:hypothetical protein
MEKRAGTKRYTATELTFTLWGIPEQWEAWRWCRASKSEHLLETGIRGIWGCEGMDRIVDRLL